MLVHSLQGWEHTEDLCFIHGWMCLCTLLVFPLVLNHLSLPVMASLSSLDRFLICFTRLHPPHLEPRQHPLTLNRHTIIPLLHQYTSPTSLYHGRMLSTLAMSQWKVLQQLVESKAVQPMHYLIDCNTMGSDIFSNGSTMSLPFACHAIQPMILFFFFFLQLQSIFCILHHVILWHWCGCR